MTKYKLPPEIIALKSARDRLQVCMNRYISDSGSDIRLKFTFDGNLVGDIGEALAVYLFGVRLVETRTHPGIDAKTQDGKSVQVKATGTNRGPAFTYAEAHADYLIFFEVDFATAQVEVVFNGPERYVRAYLPSEPFEKQRSLTRSQIRKADTKVKDNERLKPIRVN